VHRRAIPESFVAILRSRLSDFAHPIRRTFGRQCKTHPTHDHHDAAHDTQRAIFAAGNHDPGDLSLDGAATCRTVLLVERVESLDEALHQTRTSTPPDRRAEEDHVGRLDLRHQAGPIIVRRLPEAKPDRKQRVGEPNDFGVDRRQRADLVEHQ
jgi:hypothetical protein